jgi:nicotinamidase-related amidase
MHTWLVQAPSTVLLIIDVQQELFRKAVPVYQADTLLENILLLKDRARRAGAPVIYVQHANQGALKPGTDGWQIHPAVAPGPQDLLVHKTHASAFQGTRLQKMLEGADINTVVVTGLVSHGCVRATCLHARELGYRVILVRDGHSNFHREAARVIAECHQTMTAAGVELAAANALFFDQPALVPA